MEEGTLFGGKGGHTDPGPGRVAYSDQTLWRSLTEPATDADFCNAWLNLQARLLNAEAGLVVLGPPDTGPFSPAAQLPKGRDLRNLGPAVEKAISQRKGVVTKEGLPGEDPPPDKRPIHIAFPVRVSGRLHGAAAFVLPARSQERLPSLMRQLQWGAAWLENRVLRTQAAADDGVQSRIATTLDLTALALQEKSFRAAANSLVTELAARLNCERVSLGVCLNRNVKVAALSHAAQFKKEMNLVRAIEAAMAESLDQAETIVHADGAAAEKTLVTRAHGELASLGGAGAICTVPFIDHAGRGYGALTLERRTDKPFSQDEVELADTLASVVGLILEEKRLNDRWLAARLFDSAKNGAGRLVGPGHLVLKAGCAAFLAAVVFLSLAEGRYRVTARTTIEGAVQRAVVAPYDGFLSDAPVRAGDTVKEGQVLCSLDDRDMKLERVGWTSQREQLLRQYREAMAGGDRASVRILREQISQAAAQLNLLDEQISRARMVAPFDGIVITGDLSQTLGSPVQRGQVLFEIAPLEDYRLRLRVDEREINRVTPGQTGTLVLNSLPEKPLPMTIRKVTPVAAAQEGRNLFLVEADLGETTASLRPGMEGYGKIDIDRRKLVWIWTHGLYDWARLWVWTWWP